MQNQTIRSVIYIIVRATFVGLLVFSLARGQFESALIAGIGLVLSLVPQLIIKKLRLQLPLFYELVIVAFIVATIMLGEFFGAYSKLWWWDSALHLSSGVVIGYIGYMILFTLYLQGKLNVSSSMMAFLTFSVSMMVAALGEVFEFSVDQIYGAYMQKGLSDTMKDIILAMIGSLIATAAAYWHHRWPESSPLRRELKLFFKRNRHLVTQRLQRRQVAEEHRVAPLPTSRRKKS